MHGDWCPSASVVSDALVLVELCEEVAHESHSKFSFAVSLDPIQSNARQECVATKLKIGCLFPGLRSSIIDNIPPPPEVYYSIYVRTVKFVRHKSEQMICMFLAY